MTIDVGTGDGRAVLATAAAEPTTLVLGFDADASSMAESSRRAVGPARRGGLRNAMFLRVAAEAPPPPLARLASHVTVQFPWGSLLRGCLGGDPAVAAGVASLVRLGGELGLLLAPARRDRLAGLPSTTAAVIGAATAAFAPHGLAVVEARPATAHEIRNSHSTWAKRLLAGNRHGTKAIDRAVVLVRLRS